MWMHNQSGEWKRSWQKQRNKAPTHSLMYRESPSNAMDGRRKDKRSNSEGLIKLNMKKKLQIIMKGGRKTSNLHKKGYTRTQNPRWWSNRFRKIKLKTELMRKCWKSIITTPRWATELGTPFRLTFNWNSKRTRKH